jgi:hypothetical protein
MSDLLATDLLAMRGVWRDVLRAYGPDGEELSDDPDGGAPGPFPYENLVYVDFDGRSYAQTNVVLAGRPPHQRTFTATVEGGVLRFDHLGPDAPEHVGISGGPGRIWFVAASTLAEGLTRYAEPDLIRLEGDRRHRHTVLWRHGRLARVLDVRGERLGTDTSVLHPLDPREPGSAVHGPRSSTANYATPASVPEEAR